jgi:bisanhydrobacterioruberin hydratase
VQLEVIKKHLLRFLILVYVSGAIGFVCYPSFFAPFTPYTLLLTCLVFILHQPFATLNFITVFLGVSAIGFVFEVIGVHTGLIFGKYHYGYALGFSIAQVPVLIAFNWGLLVCASVLVAKHYLHNKYTIALAAATIATGIDYVIEQVCFKLDFWYFAQGKAGVHNYVGWFLLCVLACLIVDTNKLSGNVKCAAIILLLQLQFFGTVYLFGGLNI